MFVISSTGTERVKGFRQNVLCFRLYTMINGLCASHVIGFHPVFDLGFGGWHVCFISLYTSIISIKIIMLFPVSNTLEKGMGLLVYISLTVIVFGIHNLLWTGCLPNKRFLTS